MQHIPVVSHALWRGTFILKMLDVVPAIQTTGSYHRQDLCLFTVGKSLTGLGSRGERWVVERLRFPIDFKGLSSDTSSPTGTAVLGSVDLYLCQCIRESLRGGRVNSGSSVHSVGRAKVVSHPPGRCNGATSVCVPLTTSPPSAPLDPACKLPFLMQLYLARGLTDRWTAKQRLHILYKQFRYAIVSLSSEEQKNMLLCHIKMFPQHFGKVRGNTQAACKVSRNA